MVFFPELHKALSSTSYTVKTMKNDNDISRLNIIISDLGHTGIGDKPSKTQTFSRRPLPKLVENIHNKTFDKIIDNSDDIQGGGIPTIIPSNKIDIYTTVEILLGLKLSCHTATLTEARNSIRRIIQKRRSSK